MPEDDTTTAATAAAPPADPPGMDQGFLDALHGLEQHLATADVWNLDPQIFLWHPPVLAGLMVPTQHWKRVDGQPANMLANIAAQWEDVKTSLIAQDPVVFGQPPQAVVLISEGWTLPLHEAMQRGDQAKVDEYLAAANRRVIFQHPDRVEMRNTFAVDAHRNSIMIFRFRGQQEPQITDVAEGGVPEAMHEFMRKVAAPRPV